MKRIVKSLSCINYIDINGIKYYQPQNSIICCWEEVTVLGKDNKKAMILYKELDKIEVWKVG